jgi:acyl carrier protein
MEQAALFHKLQSIATKLTQSVTNLESIREQTCMQESVTSLFHDELQVEVPSPDVDLFETGVLDSLRIVELLNCLETRFGTHISQDDLEFDKFRSIAEIAQFLQDRARAIREGA